MFVSFWCLTSLVPDKAAFRVVLMDPCVASDRRCCQHSCSAVSQHAAGVRAAKDQKDKKSAKRAKEARCAYDNFQGQP